MRRFEEPVRVEPMAATESHREERAMRTAAGRARCVLVSLLALAGGTASAQTTGDIVGQVTDASSGAPVEGAAVTASSSSLQGPQIVTTDVTGSYRLSLLPPGTYKVSVEAEQHQPAERTDLNLLADKTLRVNLIVVPVEVTLPGGEVLTAPPIDTQSAETGLVVDQQLLSRLPVGKTFDSAALLAPGTQRDAFGISFHGASSPENGYLFDGLNIADPGFGVLGLIGSQGAARSTALLTNFVDQIDVKTGSYLPEYGRATGGIISVVTKSGSNELHGSIFGDLTPGALSPSPAPIVRNGNSLVTQIVPSRSYQSDFGFDLGGPIVKDRLWYHVGFAPISYETTYDRYIAAMREDPAHPGQALVDPITGLAQTTRLPGTDLYRTSSQRDYQLVGKLTYQINEDQTLIASTFIQPTSQRHWFDVGTSQGPSPQGVYVGPASATRQDQSGVQLDLLARYTGKFFEKHLILNAELGFHQQRFDTNPSVVDGIDQAKTATVLWYQPHSIGEFQAAPDACNVSGNFIPCPVDNYVTGGVGYLEYSRLNRVSGKVSAAALFEAGGHHVLKGGIDVEESRFWHKRGYSGQITLVEYDEPPLIFTFNRAFVDANGNIVDSVTSNTTTTSRAFYLQDSWSILDAVTLNAGLRWETQQLRASPDAPAAVKLTNMVAPRVQAIYDFTGQGRGKISASWGRFYESIPLDIADRLFGAERYGTGALDYCYGPSPTVGGKPASCAPLGPIRYLSGALAAPVAPDLHGQYVDQFGGSFEYEVIPDVTIGLNYTGIRLGAVIEDMASDTNYDFFIGNPGQSKPFSVGTADFSGQTATMIDPTTGRTVQIPFPKPERSYDGFTLEVRKTFSKKWLASASYTYSSLRGNYTGLVSPENKNQVDPNVTSQFDLARLLQNRSGPLPTDQPHQLQLYGAYVFDLATGLTLTTGGALRASSGTPISITGRDVDYGEGNSFLFPRGSGGRTPFTTAFDVHTGVDYAFSAPYTLRFTVDVFNVFNQQAATSVDQSYTYSNTAPIQGGTCRSRDGANAADPLAGVQQDCPDLAYARTTDGRPVVVNKNFGRPLTYQEPRSFRFGVSVSF
jgi:outer membrane receptor protein involved in Fe transport